MAIRKLNQSFAPARKEIRYLAKDFNAFRQNLVDFSKVYFPNTYTDFSAASPGTMFIELVSYASDVLSYYIDTQFRENLLPYAEEQDNVIAIAQSFGYKAKPGTAAIAQLDIYQLCPASDFSQGYAPDERYLLTISPNMVVNSPLYQASFRTKAIVDFSDPSDREITVYSVDALTKPVMYLVKKSVQVTSGVIHTTTQTFGGPQKFSVITLPDSNVLEVISIEDSNGYTWSEVDYLAQDLVFDDTQNTATSVTDQSAPPFYTLNLKRTPRRFITRYNSDFFLEIHFGSGVVDDQDSIVNLDPKQIASDEYQGNLASTALDPSDFLSTQTYGLAPSNTTLAITYVTGGGINSNVPANSINKINTIDIMNTTTGFSAGEQALYQDILTSIVVNNPDPATGGKESDSIEEIKQNATGFFNAQNRLVTAEDYMVRCFAMPPKYGGVAKAFVTRDEQINAIVRNNNSVAPIGGQFVDDRAMPNVINLYVLGYDQNKRLTTLNSDTKENLRSYLDNYRILTDEVRIYDAFPISIGVKFNVVVYKGYNLNEVLARAIDAVQNFFDIDKWQINQPIILNDLYLEIAQVDGVQSVLDLQIFNRYQFQDGSDYNPYLYDIAAATENGVIYSSLDPSCWEIRYPEKDIIANGVT